MYRFRLVGSDGEPFEPPDYRSSVLSWRQGDTIPLTRDRTLRVLGASGMRTPTDHRRWS